MADARVVGYSNGGGSSFTYDDRLIGWTLGFGVERALRNGWSVRADYRYSDYGTETIDFVTDKGTPHVFNLDTQTHELRIGVSRRF